jgi:hypothetical protein
MPNFKKLDKVTSYIRKHPEEHSQRNFLVKDKNSPCGTTACLAGTAVLLEPGYTVRWNDHYDEPAVIDPFQNQVTVSEAAREILGLTWDQAHDLFYAVVHNDGSPVTVYELEEMIDGWRHAEKAAKRAAKKAVQA